MQPNFNELEYVVGDAKVIEKMPSVSALHPFADEVVDFLNALSKQVMRAGKKYSDVVTFGFWCRRAAILYEKTNYDELESRFGKGIVFHRAPSNVPINFAFSFVAGVLAGNANIVRLPRKKFEEVAIICDVINELIEGDYANMAPYICMVRYPQTKAINDVFSLMCDARVIWGGDKTITEMRQSPLQERTTEINFADRYSIAVINADEYLKANRGEEIAQAFYNDTYFSDQNACTSPRIVIWIGVKKEIAKKEFWGNVHKIAAEKYAITPVQSVGKLTAFYRLAAKHDVKWIANDDLFITRIAIKTLNADIMNFKYNSGFFFEYNAYTLEEILPICTTKCQTLTYFGLSKEDLKKFFEVARPKGVDRAVLMGKSMDFTLVWDGIDLIEALSRKIIY